MVTQDIIKPITISIINLYLYHKKYHLLKKYISILENIYESHTYLPHTILEKS